MSREGKKSMRQGKKSQELLSIREKDQVNTESSIAAINTRGDYGSGGKEAGSGTYFAKRRGLIKDVRSLFRKNPEKEKRYLVPVKSLLENQTQGVRGKRGYVGKGLYLCAGGTFAKLGTFITKQWTPLDPIREARGN